VAAGFCALALLAVAQKADFDFAVSDGRYYWAYLPSLVVDGDLDFENQIREHWGPDFDEQLLADRTAAGRVHNKYPIGLALSLAPAFLAAHASSLGLFALTGAAGLAPDGYSVLYQLYALAWVMALGVGTLLLVDRLLTRRLGFTPRQALLAVLSYWIGTHWAYYFFREPLMVHVTSAFWVAACAHLCLLVRPERGFTDAAGLWCAAGIALTAGLALVTRPTNAVILLPFLAPLLARPGCVRAVPLLLGLGALPFLAQLVVWHRLHGSFFHYSYHDEGFHWLEPALVSTLFSSRHGLFSWAPLLVFAAAGSVLAWRAGRGSELRRVLAPWLVAAGLLWYVNSCWHQWWFGDAFGARAFLELTPLFVLGLAACLRASSALGRRARSAVLVAMALCCAWTWGLMVLYATHRIPRGDYLF
jgi:hypothetical protein